MWSTPSLSSLPSPLWPGMGTPDRVLSKSYISNIYVLSGFGIKNPTMVDMP